MIEDIQISNWITAKANLDHYKALEMNLRKEICSELFQGQQGRFKVTEHLPQWDVVANSNTTMKVDEEILNGLAEQDLLTQEDMDCFERKLSIKAALRKRPSDSQVWFAVTESPATPTLKVTPRGEDAEDSN